MSCNPYFDFKVLAEDNIPASTFNDVIDYTKRVSARYDKKTLDRVCAGATILFRNMNRDKFPSIDNRFAGGVPIGTEEMAEFVSWSNRSIENTVQFIDIILETDIGFRFDNDAGEYVSIASIIGNSDSASYLDLNTGRPVGGNVMIASPDQRQAASTIIDDYEYFLTQEVGSSIMGSFCSIFASPYKIISLIDKIKNFKIPTMGEIVNGMKSRVSDLIGKIIQTVKRKYDNLKEGIVRFVGRQRAVMKVFQNRIESVSEVFSEGNIDKAKGKISGIIDLTFAQFAEISQDVLEFIMFRLCKMTSQIENDFMQPIRNIEKMKEVFDYSRKTISSNSQGRTRSYVGSGSVRYGMSDRMLMREQATSDIGGYSSLGIDELVEAVIQAESSGNPNAVNAGTGASGLMQVMEATARDPGFGVTPLDWNQRFNADANRRFGTEYLAAMIRRYDGDQVKALVAYNWGVGNADNWDGNMGTLPNETRNYVRKILGASAQSGQPGTVTPSVYVAADITDEEMEWVNQLNGRNDSNLIFTDSVLTMGSRAKAHYESNRGYHYREDDNYADAGWKQIVLNNPSVFIMLRRVSKKLGRPLTLNSCFRSQYYNVYLAKAGTGTTSPHSKAIAVDVSMRGLSEGHRIEFVKYCSQEGFTRIAAYDQEFIHVDIMTSNGRGDWNRYYFGSEGFREAINLHIRDGFRKG